jgi:hypothetical protein
VPSRTSAAAGRRRHAGAHEPRGRRRLGRRAQCLPVPARLRRPGGTGPRHPAPEDTLWVGVDDGAAVPRQEVGRAIPADGTVSADAAATDPATCERAGDQPGVCWRYWQRVGEEVRIWTTYRDASCVLVASLTGERTRLTCAGRTATL